MVEVGRGTNPRGLTLALISKNLWNWPWNFGIWKTSLKLTTVNFNVKHGGAPFPQMAWIFPCPVSGTSGQYHWLPEAIKSPWIIPQVEKDKLVRNGLTMTPTNEHHLHSSTILKPVSYQQPCQLRTRQINKKDSYVLPWWLGCLSSWSMRHCTNFHVVISS
jgi:hypothetical protein